MKRRKITKVRTTISITKELFEESGDYIYNLSGFVEECIKREITRQKQKKERNEQLRIRSTMYSGYNATPEEIEELKQLMNNL